MNNFEIFNEFNVSKTVTNTESITVCINNSGTDIVIRFNEKFGKLYLRVHTNGEVLKEETITINKIYG